MFSHFAFLGKATVHFENDSQNIRGIVFTKLCAMIDFVSLTNRESEGDCGEPGALGQLELAAAHHSAVARLLLVDKVGLVHKADGEKCDFLDSNRSLKWQMIVT